VPKPAAELQARLHPRRSPLQGILVAQAGPARQQNPEQELQDALRQDLTALVAGLHDRSPALRLAAVEALETLGGLAVGVAPELASSLNDSDRFVRWAAARTLSKLAPAAADVVVPGLARNLLYPDPDIQIAAATALERYGSAALPAVPALDKVINPTDFEIRSGRADVEVRVPALYALEAIAQKNARAVLPVLTTALGSSASEVRETAAEVLARLGPGARASAPALIPLLNDPDEQVRRAASDALLAIEAPNR
jgi:HEAT repeat protein